MVLRKACKSNEISGGGGLSLTVLREAVTDAWQFAAAVTAVRRAKK